jgi:hypothetical protein
MKWPLFVLLVCLCALRTSKASAVASPEEIAAQDRGAAAHFRLHPQFLRRL